MLTYTASKTSQVIAANNDARLRVRRVVELFEPVIVLQNAAKNTLVVAKEHKSHQAAGCYSRLECFPSTEKTAHDGQEAVG